MRRGALRSAGELVLGAVVVVACDRPGDPTPTLGSAKASAELTPSAAASASSVEPRARTVRATLDNVSSSSGISHADVLLDGLRPSFRRCYVLALAANPAAQGKLSLSIQVQAGGAVSTVEASAPESLSGELVSCVKARIQASTFEAEREGSIKADVTFSPPR
ncbi:MAG: AgmX/PglI C-terminal domain-containing protein [Polyangiaceae bacterium]